MAPPGRVALPRRRGEGDHAGACGPIRDPELKMVHTLKMVQHLSRAHLSVVPDDRRERSREKKRAAILRAADALIAEEGLRGITMQRVADRLDCAVGTLYLYFPSKAALVAGLQGEAIDTLRASFESAQPLIDTYLAESDLDEDLVALVRLVAFGAHWVSAAVVFADEFELQRALLSEKVPLDAEDAVRDVVPVLQRLLGHPMALLHAGVSRGVLTAGDDQARALVWVAALNGVLLLEALAPVDRHLFRSNHLARQLTHDLLRGWGALSEDVDVAIAHVERLAALGPLAPPPEGPGHG